MQQDSNDLTQVSPALDLTQSEGADAELSTLNGTPLGQGSSSENVTKVEGSAEGSLSSLSPEEEVRMAAKVIRVIRVIRQGYTYNHPNNPKGGPASRERKDRARACET